MKNYLCLPLLVLIMFSEGCCLRTPYQSHGFFRGGYEDFEAQPGVYYVSFKGNALTSKTTVAKFWHRRCADICGGQSNYKIIEHNVSTSQHISSSPAVGSYAGSYAGDAGSSAGSYTGGSVSSYTTSRAEGYISCIKSD